MDRMSMWGKRGGTKRIILHMEFLGEQDLDHAIAIMREILEERRAGKYPHGLARAPKTSATAVQRRTLGKPYTPVELRRLSPQGSIPFQVDPDEVDGGRFAHEDVRGRLAEAVRAVGLQPLDADGEPAYDLAWMQRGRAVVAEMKSVVPENEERQLRLGLGQVLRYRHQLQRRFPFEVVPVLVVEAEPSDPSWIELCSSVGVRLVWPAALGRLLDELG
jgi:hypothetical protein